MIDKVQVQVSGTSGLYSPGRAANLAFLEENKQKLAETQAKIVALEDEGARQRLSLRQARHAGDPLDPGEETPVVVQHDAPGLLARSRS